MAAISSLQIGGVTYDIYAKSAAQAPVSSHELSSHSHFSTYFNGTSANSALTSKSALSAGSATSASTASCITAEVWTADTTRYLLFGSAASSTDVGYDGDLTYNPNKNLLKASGISATNVTANGLTANSFIGKQLVTVLATACTSSVTANTKDSVNALSNPKIGFYDTDATQKGYILWTDYNNTNTWVNADSAFFGGTSITDGFVVTSDQLNSILVTKNLSATNLKANTISATTVSANLSGKIYISADSNQPRVQEVCGIARL